MKVKVIREEKVLLRIIPHHTVLNSMNRKVWNSLHDIMAMYDNPLKRISWEGGLRFTFKVKDDIWWIVTMKAHPHFDPEVGDDVTKRQVEFYFCLPRSLSEVFITKVKNHEQWKRCTITEVPPDTIGIPEKSIDLYQLKYSRDNMFSLSYDYSRQTTPVRDIVQVSQEMADNDFVGIFTRLEAINRKKWKGLVDYAWESWEHGGVPQRADLSLAKLVKLAKGLTRYSFNEGKRFVDDVMTSIDKTFFHQEKGGFKQKNQVQLVNPERAELLVNGDLSSQTKHKRNLPTYKTSIQILVGAQSQAKRDMMTCSVSSAFNELNGDNRLIPIKVNINYTNQLKQFQTPLFDRDPNILSTDEIGKLIQLPTKDLQQEFKDELESNQNVETEIPKVFLDPKGIYMGTAKNRDLKLDIYLPVSDPDMLMTARAFIGSPRVGKDQAAINLVVEAKRKHGIGAVIPDVIDERNGHRGMSDAIRDHLPPEDIIDLNLGDFDWPVYIGLDTFAKNIKNERIARNRMAQELTSFLMADDVENHQTREYLRAAAKAANGDLVSLKTILTNEDYREMKIKEMGGKGTDTSLLEDFHSMAAGKQGQVAGPILVRLGELMNDDALRPIFCQRPNPQVNLERWMREGKVVIYRIPNRDLSEMATKTLMHWIVMTTFLTKLAMGGEGAPTWLVLNEPHQFLSKGLIHFTKRILSEGPKNRIAPVFLFHHFRQLPNDFVDILLSSSLNWHIFKNTNDGVYKKLDPYIQPTFTPDIAMNTTKRFQYITAWLANDGEYQTPFMVNCPELVGKRYQSLDNKKLTREHSRKYGRNIIEVEKEIEQRQRYQKKKPAGK